MHVKDHIYELKEPTAKSTYLWAAYHASQAVARFNSEEIPIEITSLLPILEDDSKTIAMTRHAMHILKVATGKVNPGQVPVMACN
jgi:hypothetical protein